MSASASPCSLRLAHITKTFSPQQIPAVNDISFDLYCGQILGLLGPSGCGKTTLLRLIAGFEQPNSGTLTIGDRVVCSAKQWVTPEARSIGMVFQDFALFPHLTVFDNIAFGLKGRNKLSHDQLRNKVVTVLELVNLAGFQRRYPHELSGGQQQRIALARALAPEPQLVLLDEPLSNLDAQVRLRLRQELRTILKTAGASAIFVTHDQEEALAVSDQVAVMNQGHLEQLAKPEQVYSNPASRFVAEFVAQANFLLAELTAEGWQTEIGCIDLTNAPAAPIGTKGWLMVRQEDVSLRHDPQGSLQVCGRQFLGREYQYQLKTPANQVLQARCGLKQVLNLGTHVSIQIDEQFAKVFPCTDTLSTTPQPAAFTSS